MFAEKLIIVTGKGGVGKTVLASALARLSARTHPTILVTAETEDGDHPFFQAHVRYQPVEVEPRLSLCRLDGNQAIREYAKRKIPFSTFYEPLFKSAMFRDFTEAAPGFQELMSLGKIFDLVMQSPYERVVFDAPATGHLKTLLDVPAATLAAVHVGPLNHNARRIQDMLLDPERTRVVLAALPDEMALTEARELVGFCRERRMNVGPVLVNQHVAPRFLPEEREELAELDGSPGLAEAVRAALAEGELAQVQTQSLEQSGLEQRVSLPRVPSHDPQTLLETLAAAIQRGLFEHD